MASASSTYSAVQPMLTPTTQEDSAPLVSTSNDTSHFLSSAPLIVNYLAQLRLASLSDDASKIRVNLTTTGATPLQSNDIFDAIDQLVIKADGAFQSTTKRPAKVDLRFRPDLMEGVQPVQVHDHYDHFNVDQGETQPSLEAMKISMESLAALVAEAREGFVDVQQTARDSKKAMDGELGTDQRAQDVATANKFQAESQQMLQRVIGSDVRIVAQNALESMAKLGQELVADSEKSETEEVVLKAVNGLETELSSLINCFQTISVQVDDLSKEIDQQAISSDHSAREAMREVAKQMGTTERSISLYNDFSMNFAVPTMQKMESLGRSSTSEQRNVFKKYYRTSMKGWTQTTETLAEEGIVDIQDMLAAGVNMIDS